LAGGVAINPTATEEDQELPTHRAIFVTPGDKLDDHAGRSYRKIDGFFGSREVSSARRTIK